MRKLQLIRKSSDVTYSYLIDVLVPPVFDYLRTISSDSALSVLLRANRVCEFDLPECSSWTNATDTPHRNYLEFVHSIKYRGQRDSKVLENFVHLLLNLETLTHLSEIVRDELTKVFGEKIEIVELPIDPPAKAGNRDSNSTSIQIHSITPETPGTVPALSTGVQNYAENRQLLPSQLPNCHTHFEPKRRNRIGNPHFLVVIAIMGLLGGLFVCLLIYDLSGWGKSFQVNANIANATVPLENSTTAGLRETGKTNHVSIGTRKLDAVESLTSTKLYNVHTTTSPLLVFPLQPFPFKVAKVTTQNLAVSSFEEFTQNMLIISQEAEEVLVSINLETAFDWPTGATPLVNSYKIKKLSLSGPFGVDNIIDILKQTPNVQYLHLNNTDNQLCQRNNGQLSLVKSIQSNAYLPILEKLILEGFHNCNEVLETLSSHLEEMRSLKGLAVYKSVIDDYNKMFIHRLFYLSRGSLIQLSFRETVIETTTPLFETRGQVILRHVTLIRLDSKLRNGTKGAIQIGKQFHKTFPALRTVTSKNGYVPWANFPNLLRCANLTKLKIGISVPPNHLTFNLAFLGDKLPSLKSADITLYFQQCAPRDFARNAVVGWQHIKDTLSSVTIRSNCKLHVDFWNVPTSLRNRRSEKYSNEGGQHVFTYQLLETSWKD